MLKHVSLDQLRAFGRELRSARETLDCSRAELAPAASISASYIAFLEKGKKSPSERVVRSLVRALQDKGLSRDHGHKLLSIVGFNEALEIEAKADEIARGINDVTKSLAWRNELAGEVQRFVTQWWSRRNLPQDRAVRTAVVPAAGWQSQFLSRAALERMLLAAARQAKTAGIERLVLVVAPDAERHSFDSVRGIGLDTKIVVQEEPKGLGDAVLRAGEVIRRGKSSAYCVILPDDLDTERGVLKSMVHACQETGRSLVAVSSGRRWNEKGYFGVATIAAEKVRGRVRRITYLEEKPHRELARDERKIVGRYVLANESLDALQRLNPNPQTKRVELTDALNQLVQDGYAVMAYEVDHPLVELAVVQALMERMTRSMEMGDLKQSEEIVQLVDASLLISDIGEAVLRKRLVRKVVQVVEEGTNTHRTKKQKPRQAKQEKTAP